MADRKISDLTALTTPASGDYVPIVDISEAAAASKNKRVTIQSLFQGIPVNVGIGTYAPGALLDVREPANAVSQQIRLTNTNTIGTVGSAIKFQGFYDTALISSDGVPTISTGGSLRLQTYSSNGVLNTGINVDRLGNVGIGTSSPGYALDVQIATSSANTGARIYNSTSGTGNSASLSFSVANAFSSTNQHAAIQAISEVSTNTLTSLAFLTSGGSNAGNATERLRIDSSGRVGIGTSSPWTPGILDCFGNAKFGASSTNGLYLGITSGTPYIQGYNTTTPSSSVLAFYGGSGESMRIDSSGRVGIGTSSPGFLLDVAGQARFGASPGALYLGVGNAFVVGQGELYSIGTAPIGIGTGGSASLNLYTNSTERLRIDSSGNVGIGTSSPGEKLTIAGTSGSAAISLLETGVRNWAIRAGGALTNTLDVADLTAGATRLTIDSSGRVGIGTNSPTTLLDVNADTVRVRTARTPASASATGATGEICWDANYIYVCTATNTWRRTAISSW